jgi:5-(carboxyamino)imidazole ribonucleotide synthase
MTIIGILGGGHLARVTTQAAQRLGANVAVLDLDENSPAAQITSLGIEGDWTDLELVSDMAASCDVISPETEAVPLLVLQQLETEGRVVRPSSRTVGFTRDRYVQKQVLTDNGFAVAPFAVVNSTDDIRAFAEVHGYPLFLKTRSLGHDGGGNLFVPSAGEVQKSYDQLSVQGRGLIVEQYQWHYRELAIGGVRGQDGQVRLYDITETRYADYQLQGAWAPAQDRFTEYLTEKGRVDGAVYFDGVPDLAKRVAELFEIIGAFCIELFEMRDGRILINDVAPRPHLALSWTTEGSITSIFENHVRALLGLPLGWTDRIAPFAATCVMLSRGDTLPGAQDFVAFAQMRGAHMHWYGRTSTRRGRKLGHVTGLADTDPEAERIAQMSTVALLGW